MNARIVWLGLGWSLLALGGWGLVDSLGGSSERESRAPVGQASARRGAGTTPGVVATAGLRPQRPVAGALAPVAPPTPEGLSAGSLPSPGEPVPVLDTKTGHVSWPRKSVAKPAGRVHPAKPKATLDPEGHEAAAPHEMAVAEACGGTVPQRVRNAEDALRALEAQAMGRMSDLEARQHRAERVWDEATAALAGADMLEGEAEVACAGDALEQLARYGLLDEGELPRGSLTDEPDAAMQRVLAVVSRMRARDAARVVGGWDAPFAASVLAKLPARKVSGILAAMPPDLAAGLSETLAMRALFVDAKKGGSR